MADLSVPTRVVVQQIVGGGSVTLDVTSVTVDESWGDKSRATISTQTAPPNWYVNVDFPVNAIYVEADGDRLFTGYVVNWGRAKPPNEWAVEAIDVLWVAENEWIVPDSIEEMLTYYGDAEAFVYSLLTERCHYTNVTVELPAPFILGVSEEEGFEYGLESVEQLIQRLNAVLQTSLWADQNGHVYWKYRQKKPEITLSNSCSVPGTFNYGIEYRNRNPTYVQSLVSGSCAAYYAEIWGYYNTYNALGHVLAEHRNYARGNLLDWEFIKDEDPYRNKCVVFGKPPIKATWPPGLEYLEDNYPYAPLSFVDNTAIVSSYLIQDQMVAQEVANRMAEQYILRNALRWQAIGNADFHIGLDHFIDCNAFFGFGRVVMVTHTIDDAGYQMRGESQIGAYGREMKWAYIETLFEGSWARASRYWLTWEIPVVYSNGQFRAPSGTIDWDFDYIKEDVDITEYDTNTYYLDVSPTVIQSMSGLADIAFYLWPHTETVRDVVTSEELEVTSWGYLLVGGTGWPGGIWKSGLAACWDDELSIETVRAIENWECIVTYDQMRAQLWAERGQWVHYLHDYYEPNPGGGPIERWVAYEHESYDNFTVGGFQFYRMHPYETVTKGLTLAWGVEVDGFQFHGKPNYLDPDDWDHWVWYAARHHIFYSMWLGAEPRGLKIDGIAHYDRGYTPPFNGIEWEQEYAGAFDSSLGGYGSAVQTGGRWPGPGDPIGSIVCFVGRPLLHPVSILYTGGGIQYGGQEYEFGDGWTEGGTVLKMQAWANRGPHQIAFTGHSMRGNIAKYLHLPGYSQSNVAHLPVSGGGLLHWQGVVLWGGIPCWSGFEAEQTLLEEAPGYYNTLKNWYGPPAPFVTDLRKPWYYTVHQGAADMNVGRQHALWDTIGSGCEDWKEFLNDIIETAANSYYEPAHGQFRWDFVWHELNNDGAPDMTYEVERLYSPRSWAFFCNRRRYMPQNINYDGSGSGSLPYLSQHCADCVNRTWFGWRHDDIPDLDKNFGSLQAGPAGLCRPGEKYAIIDLKTAGKARDPAISRTLELHERIRLEDDGSLTYYMGGMPQHVEF